MPYLTKYGTYFGSVPAQLGRVHFVAPSASYTVDGRAFIASDSNDGLSPERALLTLSQALTNITASAGEVIILLEGTHSQTATVRVQKAGITIAGVRSPFGTDVVASSALSGAGIKSKLSFTGAAAPGLSIEADDVELCFLELRPASGFSGVIFRNASPDGLFIHDVVFNLAAGQPISLATLGIDFGYRADVAGLAGTSMTRLTQTSKRATAYIANSAFISGGANGNGILTATVDLTVVGCRFHTRAGAWATPFAVATGTGYVYIKNTTWTAQGLTGFGVQLDGTNAGTLTNKVAAHDCRFHPKQAGVNSPIDNWATNVIAVAECYEGNNNVGAPASGTTGLASPYQTISSV